MQIWAESGKSALPICNYSQILYQFLTFTQNLKRSQNTIKNPSIHFLLRNYTLIKHPKKENHQLKMNPVKVPLQKVS